MQVIDEMVLVFEKIFLEERERVGSTRLAIRRALEVLPDPPTPITIAIAANDDDGKLPTMDKIIVSFNEIFAPLQ